MNKIEIVHFDIYQKIAMNYHRNFLIPNYREQIIAAIQASDDINLIEIYEIMNMQVIELQNDTKPTQPIIRLKIFCYSYQYLYIFSGAHWQTYIVKS